MFHEEVVMSFYKRLIQKGEFILRLLLAIFFLVACTAKSGISETQKPSEKIRKEMIKELKTLKSTLIKEQQQKNLTKTNKQTKSHIIERIIKNSVGCVCKALLFPFSTVTNATEKYSRNKYESDFAAENIALKYEEVERINQINMYKQNLLNYMPAETIEQAIKDPNTPAKKLLKMESIQSQIKTLENNQQKYLSLIHNIDPQSSSRFSILMIRGLATVLAGSISWKLYDAAHTFITAPKKKKLAMKSLLRKKSQEISNINQKIKALEPQTDSKGSPEPMPEELLTLTTQKQLLEEERKKITQDLVNKVYKQPNTLSRIAQASSSALCASAAYLLAKKYTTYQKKNLTLLEEQKLLLLKNNIEKQKNQATSLKKQFKKIKTNYQQIYGKPDKEIIPQLLAIRTLKNDLEKIKRRRALGENIVFGNLIRYLLPIIHQITGGVIPMDI